MIAHDFMETYGGAERVTQEMATAFPDAEVVALLGRKAVARRMGVEDRFRSLLPARKRLLDSYRLLTPAFPVLADSVRLPSADVVLSSSYAFAHRLRSQSGGARVCYCHSPLRFAWTMTDGYRERLAKGQAGARSFSLLAAAMRASDRRSSAGVDRYLTGSPYVAGQIERFYGRSAEVIGVPVDCDLFTPARSPRADFFLLSGRLVEPYKRVTLAIDAFRRLPERRLVIAGDGPALPELRASAPANVRFTGHLGDAELARLMRNCLAGVFPSRDDFGLVPAEVMASGRPVIAYGAGGALHTVAPGVTGEFFHEQTADALVECLAAFDPGRYDPRAIRAHAEQWDRGRFRERLREAVALAAP